MPDLPDAAAMRRLVPVEPLGAALARVTEDHRWQHFEASLITGGKSNLTFELRSAAGELILRRPPEGPFPPRAHDMAREVRVQRALVGTNIPIAEIVLADTTADLLGVPLYVMRKVDGIIVRDALPGGYANSEGDRRRIAEAIIDTLAQLHTLDPTRIGLADFGRPVNFLARQLRRWQSQVEILGHTNDVLGKLARALDRRIPDSPAPTLIHGDFRLDNCILDADDPGKVAAVLDWEMATLGDPLTDLALLLFYWVRPGDHVAALAPRATMADGFPPRSYLLDRYAKQSGRDLSNLAFYEALARLKFAAIISGVAARSAAGVMAGQHFGSVDVDVIRLAEEGLDILGQAP
jgi:aminoglycoside phosphotransferase (APT) family kinase protein